MKPEESIGQPLASQKQDQTRINMSSERSSSIKRGTSSIKSPKSPRSPRIKIGDSIVSDTELEDNITEASAPIVKKDKAALKIEIEDQWRNFRSGESTSLPYILQSGSVTLKEKDTLRIHFEHQEGCKHAEEFIRIIRDQFPNAVFEIQTSQEDCFEYSLNEKVVFSRRILKRWPGQKTKKGGPDFEELIEVTYWMEQGKSFMHMYLCSFVERRGNEDVHMAINDKRNTPLAKRIILSCTIS